MSKKKCVKSLSRDFFNIIGDLKIDDKKGDHDGWLICDGRELDREEYAELFAMIGTGFGDGDGKTTFNLPDFSDETIWKNRMLKDNGYITEGAPQVAGYVKGDVFVPADHKLETVDVPKLSVNVFILAKKIYE